MKRRDFIASVCTTTVTWPFVVNAQQRTVPLVGLLNSVSFESYADRMVAFHQGLKETGFTEQSNVNFEYRSADGNTAVIPSLAADLVRRHVTVLVTMGGDTTAHAAKAATSTIPIVFATGSDPSENGLVRNLNRPEGNLTGVSFFSTELGAKRLELLKDLLPQATLFGSLMGSQGNVAKFTRELELSAERAGLRTVSISATKSEDLENAFVTFVERRVAAVVVSNDAFLNSKRELIAALAARHAIPAIYAYREHIRAGGLLAYGTDVNEMFRQAGIYTGRILKGMKPGELPVQYPTKFDLIINLKAAKALGLTVPPTLLARADEVIE